MNYVITTFPYWNYVPKDITEENLNLFNKFIDKFNETFKFEKKELKIMETPVKIFPMEEFLRLHNNLINHFKNTLDIEKDKLFLYHIPQNMFLNYDINNNNEDVIVLDVNKDYEEYVKNIMIKYFDNIQFKN